MFTQAFGVPYNENRLSDEEIWELEIFLIELEQMLNKKVKDMGLHIVEGCITKFTEEQLEFMKNKFEEAKQLLEEEIKG